MKNVTLTLLGKPHQLACSPDQEPQLQAMAAYLDGRLRGLKNQMPHAQESMLWLVLGLMLADELHDAKAGGVKKSDDLLTPVQQHQLNLLAERLEKIAG